MERIKNLLMALSLAIDLPQLAQRTALTWPLLARALPLLRLFFVIDAKYCCLFVQTNASWLTKKYQQKYHCVQECFCK